MIEYRIMPEVALVVVEARGVTGLSEILTMSGDLRSDPLFSSEYDALVDDSELVEPPTGEELRSLAEPRVRPGRAHVKLAVIAPADLIYGISRMHQMMAETREPHEVQVFRDRRSALEWLGREHAGVEEVLDEMAAALDDKADQADGS